MSLRGRYIIILLILTIVNIADERKGCHSECEPFYRCKIGINKKRPISGTLFERKLRLVGRSDVRWNTVEGSLVLMYRKMVDLGFIFNGEEVIPPDEVKA